MAMTSDGSRVLVNLMDSRVALLVGGRGLVTVVVMVVGDNSDGRQSCSMALPGGDPVDDHIGEEDEKLSTRSNGRRAL